MDALTTNSFSTEAFEARVKERFESRADILAAIGGDQVLNPNHPKIAKNQTYKSAAVLVPIIDRDGEANVLLTQRTENLSSHSGQVAFPGGKIDEGESPEEAALREAWEEVGLQPEQVDVIGTFGTYFSGSGYSISPVVGMVREAPKLKLNPDEVAAAFEVPLSFLMDQNNHHRHSRFWAETEVFFYKIPYSDGSMQPAIERDIWGVTAGIIRMIGDRLYGSAHDDE